jgi:hypothetical protein
MRKFNTTGVCDKEEHYMVDISEKLKQIRIMVDEGEYFTINRGRQYGKTTTLLALEEELKDDYMVISISFEGIGCESFATPEAFCGMLLRRMNKKTVFMYEQSPWLNPEVVSFEGLSEHISDVCKGRKVVLMIDEVDKSSNNQIFLHFLGMLRTMYLDRKRFPTFHSVILAGVNDIKNIKQKMITSGTHTQNSGEGIYNSPWNIAAKFKVDMSFNPVEIETMLSDYESEHSTGTNMTEIAKEIYGYTSGYPFLVSCICKTIDEELDKDWTVNGIQEAIKIILDDNDNTLLGNLIKQIKDNAELAALVRSLVIFGDQRPFNIHDTAINLGVMYGFLERKNGLVTISNKIFEICITSYSIVREIAIKDGINPIRSSIVVKNGRFDMETCLRKFSEHYYELFAERDTKFLEREGRMLFLTYLKPLINGAGFYYIEAETRDSQRMDIVLDYNKEQFIIELKVWYGEKHHDAAYAQLLDYMKYKRIDTGYLLTFDFRKESNKERKAEWVDFDNNRQIFDVVI